jgi:hypothetical protein
MNAHQRTALDHPCLLAGETVHHRFAWWEGAFSHVLTVNAGYE